MEKSELFINTLKNNPAFNEYKQDDLVGIGRLLGSKQVVFKEVYKAYLDKKGSYEHQPVIGPKVELIFDWKNEEVIIKKLKIELNFTIKTFLDFLSLIDISYLEIPPIGSVVELDLDMMSEQVRRMYQDSEALVSISGRKVMLGDGLKYFVDYVGRVWPFGEGPLTPPIFLSNAHIKRIVFTGMVDEGEEEFVQKALRRHTIDLKRKSIAYLTDEEKRDVDYVIQEQSYVKEGI